MRLMTLTLIAHLLIPLLAATDAKSDEPASLLDLEAQRLTGQTESLGDYRGQVLLVVNTASRCGYTPQYAGFPSNDFGNQEPGSAEEIGRFCQANYGVEFPMFSKVRVRGDDAHPVYRYLTSRPEPIGGPVKWNFQKYLVDRSGNVVARFDSGVTPSDPALTSRIEQLLAEGAQQASAW